MFSKTAALTLSLTLAAPALLACGPEEGAAQGAAVGAGGGAASGPEVRGRVLYADRPALPEGLGPPTPRPARGILVLALDAAGVTRGSARTNKYGAFSIAVALPEGQPFALRAMADMERDGHGVRVWTDTPQGRPHFLDSAPMIAGHAPASIELLAPADGVGGAFNVLDVSYEALGVLAAGLPAQLPVLTIAWERGRGRPCTSCYRHEDESIQLGADPSDTDEYDDDIILHELGHYFVEHTHADNNPGGFHRDRRVAPTHAWAEGLAYFLSCLVRESPRVVDTYGASTRVWDFEQVTLAGQGIPEAYGTADGQATGALREEVPGSILWDVHDAARPTEPFDRVALDRDRHLRLIFGGVRDNPARGVPGIDLVDYLDALACDAGVPPADLAALASSRGFPWTPPACGP